jgi:transcriptional regulator with XRE-family HTH domain
MLSEQEKLPPEPASQFARRLRTLREAQGLSIRDLAALIGVSSVTIWKWEKGDSKPRARSLPPLAKALDVSPSSLAPIASMIRAPKSAVGLKALASPLVDQAEPAATGAGNSASLGNQEALADVIARAKQMIAEASGVGPNSITIRIEY